MYVDTRSEYDQSILSATLPPEAVSPDVFGRLAFQHGVEDSDTQLLRLLAASRMVDGARAPIETDEVNELDHLDAQESWCLVASVTDLLNTIPETSFRSHSRSAILDAMLEGRGAWVLDTSTGDDDVLLGGRADVERDVLAHHEKAKWPDEWDLRQLTP